MFGRSPRAQARLAALRSAEVAVACGLEQMLELPDFGADLAWTRQVSTLSIMAYLNAAHGASSIRGCGSRPISRSTGSTSSRSCSVASHSRLQPW